MPQDRAHWAMPDQLAALKGRGRSVGVYGSITRHVDFLRVSDGVADATNHVNNIIANCPATRLELGGFRRARRSLTFGGCRTSVPPIPGVPGIPGGLGPLPDIPGLPVPYLDWTSFPASAHQPLRSAAVDHVGAVAVFGNPLTRVSGPLNGPAGPYGPKTIDLCHADDPICGGGGDMTTHYEDVPVLTDQAAAFAAASCMPS